VGKSVEAKARAHFMLGMSIKALGEAAGISRASAQKYHAMLSAEQRISAAQ
jgi:response regulator of citrate/malate metabolism